MTGMTRDGLFLIEKGRVSSAARNFRFNQSILEMLRNVEMMGPPCAQPGKRPLRWLARYESPRLSLLGSHQVLIIPWL